MKYTLCLSLFYLYAYALPAQPVIQWQRCLGGSYAEKAKSIQQTTDGGYIVAGFTLSNNDGDVTNYHGAGDCWIVKLTNTGAIEWQKSLGGSSTELAECIQQTSDGGYIMASTAFSDDGDISGNHGNGDCWIVKLDNFGLIQWQRTLGGSGRDEANFIQQTLDGGYILAGNSNSSDGDVLVNYGSNDFWIVKLSINGDIQWQKNYGGSGSEYPKCIRQTIDEGYIICGESNSNDGDVTDNHGSVDFWVVKISKTGVLEWQNALGGDGIDSATSIAQTNDGGYILTGVTGSGNSGDITGSHGGFDYWVVKLNADGAIDWQKTFGGSDEDWGHSIAQTSDGGYVVLGTTRSTDGDATGNDGGQDFLIVKISNLGDLEWRETLGGMQGEFAYAIQQTVDGGYALIGDTWSNDGDVSGAHGQEDMWVVKLSPEPLAVKDIPTQSAPLETYPNPASDKITVQAAGETTLDIQISDLLGRNILQQSISNGEILEVASLSDGLYIVTARTPDGKVYTRRFLRQKGS